MPSGIFGLPADVPQSTPIDLEDVKFSLQDGWLVIRPVEHYSTANSYKKRSNAERRKSKRKRKHQKQAS